MEHTLFTYRNLEELRKIQEEREVFPFRLNKLKICSISALIFALTYLHWFIFC